MAMSIDERQELALELYRSRHGMSTAGTMNSTGTLGRRGGGTMGRNKQSSTAAASLGKSPPRPSPASVAYHSDEESLKCYDENPDDSSVTEKPSEVSSSESQVGILFVVIGYLWCHSMFFHSISYSRLIWNHSNQSSFSFNKCLSVLFL